MTIERGVEWGAAGRVPADAALHDSDAALAAAVGGAVLAGRLPPVVRLVGGDLYATLGRPAVIEPGDDARLLPVDALRVSLDGHVDRIVVAHLVARRSWWRGPVVAVMNAQFVGRFDVAPRGHPNDGRADVVETDVMPLRQRWQAWRRLPNGTHVPHPQVRERRVTSMDLQFERPLRVWLDGVPAGSATTIAVRVVPDAFVTAV